MKKNFLFVFLGALVLIRFSMIWMPSSHKAPPPPSPLPLEENRLKFKEIGFDKLPHWNKTARQSSLIAFKKSCVRFLKAPPSKEVGSTQIPIQAKDWQPVCERAQHINIKNENEIKSFFEHEFKVIGFYQKNGVEGLFTGYYMPYLHGSLKATSKYRYPLYQRPKDLIHVNLELFDPNLRHKNLFGRVSASSLIPYYTRSEIDAGKIKKNAPVLAYVDSDIDRLFLEIQGSGIVKLDTGKTLAVGYAAQNGAPYTPIGRVLLEKGVIKREDLSMQTIKAYLLSHPDEIKSVIHQNKSFVFFQKLSSTQALGAMGIALTPGYSLAIDRQWIPLGAPLWLTTTYPNEQNPQKPHTLNRLMIAQDTGGAIKGAVRGDVYWGATDEATYIAGHMKNTGHYWLLLPKTVLLNEPK